MLIHKSIKILPGLSTLNRLGGAALGAVYTAILVVIGLTLIRDRRVRRRTGRTGAAGLRDDLR